MNFTKNQMIAGVMMLIALLASIIIFIRCGSDSKQNRSGATFGASSNLTISARCIDSTNITGQIIISLRGSSTKYDTVDQNTLLNWPVNDGDTITINCNGLQPDTIVVDSLNLLDTISIGMVSLSDSSTYAVFGNYVSNKLTQVRENANNIGTVSNGTYELTFGAGNDNVIEYLNVGSSKTTLLAKLKLKSNRKRARIDVSFNDTSKGTTLPKPGNKDN